MSPSTQRSALHEAGYCAAGRPSATSTGTGTGKNGASRDSKTSGDVDLASMQLRRVHRTPRSRIARPSKVYQEAGQEKVI
jgi:hypothetical protein